MVPVGTRRPHGRPFRDWYVWRDEIPEGGPDGLVFPDEEDSNWEWDEQAGQYYLHRFYKHQPDLNIANPRVREEVRKIVGFWLEIGLSGFRVDAVPFLLETDGIGARWTSRRMTGSGTCAASSGAARRRPADGRGQPRIRGRAPVLR
jgi:glycosidase